jgi:hypothetical protein
MPTQRYGGRGERSPKTNDDSVRCSDATRLQKQEYQKDDVLVESRDSPTEGAVQLGSQKICTSPTSQVEEKRRRDLPNVCSL